MDRGQRVGTVVLVSAVLSGLGAREVAAFRISTTLTQACHETVTLDAWRASSIDQPATPMSEEDGRVAADVPFDLAEGVQRRGERDLRLGRRRGLPAPQFGPGRGQQYRITTGLERRF